VPARVIVHAPSHVGLRAVGAVLDQGRFPIVLGGDCTILLGITLALGRRDRSTGSPMGRVYRETTPAMVASATAALDERIGCALAVATYPITPQYAPSLPLFSAGQHADGSEATRCNVW
jgi:hypothetical protein